MAFNALQSWNIPQMGGNPLFDHTGLGAGLQGALGTNMAGLPNWGGTGFTTPPAASGLFGVQGLTGMGALGMGLQSLDSLGKLFSGMQTYKLGKETLNFQKDAFNKNFENQRKMTNAALEGRQRARVASNPTGYLSVDEYMNRYGV